MKGDNDDLAYPSHIVAVVDTRRATGKASFRAGMYVLGDLPKGKFVTIGGFTEPKFFTLTSLYNLHLLSEARP